MLSRAGKLGFEGLNKVDKGLFLMGIHEAFIQDEHRGFVLMSTGSAELVYTAPKSYLTENNRYGKLLMKMRHIIANEIE